MAQFGAPATDANLTQGFTAQANTPPGYGSATATTTTNYAPGQAGSGTPQPSGTGASTTADQAEAVLGQNAGYSNSTGPAIRQLPANIGGVIVNAPAMTTLVTATNPTNLVAIVTNNTPADVTAVSIKTAGGAVISTTVQPSGAYMVPAGGSITATFSGGTWTWTV